MVYMEKLLESSRQSSVDRFDTRSLGKVVVGKENLINLYLASDTTKLSKDLHSIIHLKKY